MFERFDCLKGSLGLLSCLVALGCSGVGPNEEPAASSSEALYRIGTPWPGGNVPVCWSSSSVSRPNFAVESRTFRDRANDTWPTVAKVNFTGWATCSANPIGMLRLTLNDGQTGGSGTGYVANAPVDLNIGVPLMNQDKGAVPLLLGLALGYTYDYARNDFDDGPRGGMQCSGANVAGGDKVDTAPDDQSIMVSTGLCNHNTELSLWDVIGVQKTYGARVTQVTPLRTGLFSFDYATVASQAGVDSLDQAQYTWEFADGWVFTSQVPGTVPLKLFWNPTKKDNFTTATAAGEQSAIAAGYQFIRTEGYVFSSSQGNATVPLKTYFSNADGIVSDNILVTPGPSEERAKAGGYTFVRIEGYIPKQTPYALLWTYWSGSREDNLLTKQNTQLAVDAENAGYDFFGFDGAVWRFQLPGTTPLMNYYSSARGDHFALATTGSQTDALAAGYFLVTDENQTAGGASQFNGYVYSSAVNGMSPLKSFYNDARGDHFTTIGRESTATAFGYRSIRTEGWGLGINP